MANSLGIGSRIAAGLAATIVTGLAVPAGSATAARCGADAGGITLAPGFCATIFADDIGHARHMVVAPDGTVYVNTWSGSFYRNSKTVAGGGFLVALKDSTGAGHADIVRRFGPDAAQGGAGGTGIALYHGALYAEANDRIVRYALRPGEIVPADAPTTVVSGLPLTGDHKMHPLVIDGDGNLFVNMGSATNTCEKENRMPGSTGNRPCTEQLTRAGIWRYDANATGQKFSPAERFATGIRNTGGMAFDAAGGMYATQHGRDQLLQNWPALYRPDQGPELPAEELVRVERGGDYGWPTCYYDGFQKKLVLAPEYGGDGGKTVGLCAEKRAPVAAFPAHWAPNDLLIYHGTQFPKAYRGGAFIAFHGSWNRAPAPQAGFNIVFQPLAQGKASGRFVVFADGFAGPMKDAGAAEFRPAGLATGPDGALYIADDSHGRIWRVTYSGSADAPVAAAAPLHPARHPAAIAGAEPALPVPPGATREQVALGNRIFHGEAAGGTCSGCHGADARGSSVGPNLTGPTWLWGDGSLKALTATIVSGVAQPRQYSGGMPPRGGAPLSPADVAAVAAYTWAVAHPAR